LPSFILRRKGGTGWWICYEALEKYSLFAKLRGPTKGGKKATFIPNLFRVEIFYKNG
jgi:hypothetical protein